MNVRFYDTRIGDDHSVFLVKEKEVCYQGNGLSSPREIVDMMNYLVDMKHLGEEHCYLLCFNSKNRVLGVFLLSKGTINSSLIGQREALLRAVLLCGSVNICLVHNHPSKDVFPSKEDRDVTRKIKEATDMIGIHLIDHIIIGGDDLFSFLENSLI